MMFDENSYKSKMSKTIDVFSKDLSSLRTGRANSNMLDLIIIKSSIFELARPVRKELKSLEKTSIVFDIFDL